MKAYVLGVVGMAGKAKKTGSDYQIRRAYVGSPIQSKTTEAYTRTGYGMEPTEVEVDEAALPLFAAHKLPGVLDLVTDMRPIGGKLVPVITGVRAAA